MYYLGIESSCDETSIAILEGNTNLKTSTDFLSYLNSFKILANTVSSQVLIHQKYGGVVPEIGAREHAKGIHSVYNQALKQANLSHLDLINNLDKIFVTTNPGLVSALRVGQEFAKTLTFFSKQQIQREVEIVDINHLDGHLASCFYNSDKIQTNIFPHLHLLVSGGNTQLILLQDFNNKQIVGKTLDDAAGECFDKIGRMLGLKYPAGVLISKIADLNNSANISNLPIGMSKDTSLNFSYSGLKTAVRYLIEKQKFDSWKYEQSLTDKEIEYLLDPNPGIKIDHLEFIKNICISAQYVIIKQLQNKLNLAIKEFNPTSIGLSGGVSANSALRNSIQKNTKRQVLIAPRNLTGDNGAMIALAGVAGLF